MDAPKAGAGDVFPQPAQPAPEAVRAEQVAEEVKAAPPAQKKALAIDQKLLMSEVQLLLAEKRTAFALLRTGVTVALVPLSLWTLLVTTSRLYNVFDVLWLLVPIMSIAAALFLLGVYLIAHALQHVRHVERIMAGIKKSDTLLEDLIFREVGSPLPDFGVGLLRRLRRGEGGAS